MMTLEKAIANDEQYYMPVFGKRVPVCLDRGEGIYLYDTEGNRYADFFAGIAVNALGHSHPKIVRAICEQAQKMIHCSNLYYTEPQARLIELLAGVTCCDRFFLANSGAEANEAAFKLARAYFKKKGQPEKYGFVCLQHSFHGRTITTATATGQEKYKKPFAPLTPGFSHVPINDWEALVAALDEHTCAVVVEPVQGESGVYPLDRAYAQKLRALCDERELLLIFDEVQTGFGRTGYPFGYQMLGVEPDILTMAKALGCGFPIGAMGAKEKVASGFAVGDHGSTFGGNPLACAVACAAIEEIFGQKLWENAAALGAYIRRELEAHADAIGLREARCVGLMLGIEFADAKAPAVRQRLFEKGWLVGSVGDRILRVLPPLIITEQDAKAFLETLYACAGAAL